MSSNSNSIRELIDFFIAIGAWAVSIVVIFLLFQSFILPHIPT